MHLFAPLRAPLVLLALAALPAAPTAAQTCAASIKLDLAFGDDAGHASVPLPTLYQTEVTTVERAGVQFQTPSQPVVPFDSILAAPEGWVVDYDHLGTVGENRPTDNIAVRTYCGYYLMRFTLTPEDGGDPMVIELYNVPPHLPYRFSDPILVRPGRFRLDIGHVGWTEGEYPYRILQTSTLEVVE